MYPSQIHWGFFPMYLHSMTQAMKQPLPGICQDTITEDRNSLEGLAPAIQYSGPEMTQHFCSLLIGQNKSCGPTQLRESRKEQPYPVLRRDSNGNIWWTFITNRVSQISLDLLELFWLLLSIPELEPQLTLRNLGVPEAWPELTEAGKEKWSQRRLMEPGSQEVCVCVCVSSQVSGNAHIEIRQQSDTMLDPRHLGSWV